MSDALALFPLDEFRFMTDFFDSAVDILSGSSDNSFTVEYSSEREEVILDMACRHVAKHGVADREEWRRKCRLNEKTLFMWDYAAAGYFATHFPDSARKAISLAEAQIAADLLDHMAVRYESWRRGRASHLYYMNLIATPRNKAFMLAALGLAESKDDDAVARIESAADTISVPSDIALSYLSRRCRELAAAGGTIRIASAEDATPTGKNGIPHVVPQGVASRFPVVKKYAKDQWCFLPNWQDEDIAYLKSYAEGGADRAVSGEVLRNHLERSSQALRQIAIQVAFGVPVEERKVSKGLKACIKFVAKQYEGQQRFMNGEQKDSGIAAQLFVSEGYDPEEIEQAILAYHSPTAESSEGQRAHAHKVTRMVVDSPQYQKMRTKKLLAYECMVKYRGEIGSDWQIPWRRAMAYRYWACAMVQQAPGNAEPGLVHGIPTAIYCILSGWHDSARRLLQGIHHRLATFGVMAWGRKTHAQRRTHLFALQLTDVWSGDAGKTYPPEAQDPVFDALLTHWNHPDPAAVAPLLIAACDRRTHCAVARQELAELECAEYWYDPFEVHMVLYLRRERGLENPMLDHPVMNTPLGKLPEAVPPYGEPLLDAVKTRSRSEMPSLADW